MMMMIMVIGWSVVEMKINLIIWDRDWFKDEDDEERKKNNMKNQIDEDNDEEGNIYSSTGRKLQINCWIDG